MRKKLFAIAFAGSLALSVAVPAFAAHDQGNGNSQDENVAICHQSGSKEHTIYVSGDEDTLDDHADHGDDITGGCVA